jgi:hypothetical protein
MARGMTYGPRYELSVDGRSLQKVPMLECDPHTFHGFS